MLCEGCYVVGEYAHGGPLCAPCFADAIFCVLALVAGKLCGHVLVGVQKVHYFQGGGRAGWVCCVDGRPEVGTRALQAELVVFEECSSSLVLAELHHGVPFFWCVFLGFGLARRGGCHAVPPCWGYFGSFLPWLCWDLCPGLGWCVGLWSSAGFVLFAHKVLYVMVWAGCMGYVHVLWEQPVAQWEGFGW